MKATNIYFSKIVKMGERLREFNFRKIPSTDNEFHVDVTDDRGNRHMFILSKKNGGLAFQCLQYSGMARACGTQPGTDC